MSPFNGTPSECLMNDLEIAGWNLQTLGKDLNFDILDFIKSVNFMREQKYEKPPTKEVKLNE